MQISNTTAVGAVSNPYSGGLARAAAVLQAPSADLGAQLGAYKALASRWRDADATQQAALTDSAFAKTVQSTLNAFTRAAWAGPDAVPPEPQAQMLKAFDALSDEDRQIVAALHGKSAAVTAPADYRAKLQADLDAAQAGATPARRADSVTLSAEAQAQLSSGTAPAPEPPTPAEAPRNPQVAAALAAYARVAR